MGWSKRKSSNLVYIGLIVGAEMISKKLVIAHLRIDDDELEEEWTYIEHLVGAAIDTFNDQTNRTLVAAENNLPNPVGNALVINGRITQGALLLVGQWYANRENVVIGVSVAELPAATESLWAPYRWFNV